jgi:hypothetical protein
MKGENKEMMKMEHDRKHACVTLFVAVLMLAAFVGTASATAQTWHFWDDAYPGTHAIDGFTHKLNANMSKAGYGDGSLFVNLTTNQVAWWYALYPAQVDVPFGDGNWLAPIYYNFTEAGKSGTVYVDVYSVTTSGTLERRLANGSAALSSQGGVTYQNIPCYDDPATVQTVLTGDRLAVRVKYNGTGTFQCGYNGPTGVDPDTPSRIIGPTNDPGYPVPELSTIILMSTGLLVLMGYVVYSRRRNNKK